MFMSDWFRARVGFAFLMVGFVFLRVGLVLGLVWSLFRVGLGSM